MPQIAQNAIRVAKSTSSPNITSEDIQVAVTINPLTADDSSLASADVTIPQIWEAND